MALLKKGFTEFLCLAVVILSVSLCLADETEYGLAGFTDSAAMENAVYVAIEDASDDNQAFSEMTAPGSMSAEQDELPDLFDLDEPASDLSMDEDAGFVDDSWLSEELFFDEEPETESDWMEDGSELEEITEGAENWFPEEKITEEAEELADASDYVPGESYEWAEGVAWTLRDEVTGDTQERTLYFTLEGNSSTTIEHSLYSSNSTLPWGPYLRTITRVVFERIKEEADTQDTKLTINSGVFKEMPKLRSVSFSHFGVFDKVSIGSSSFRDCYLLQEISLPKALTSIGKYAFEGDVSLEYIEIGEMVTDIGEDAFRDCKGLKKVKFLGDPSGITNSVFINDTLEVGLLPDYFAWSDVYETSYNINDHITWVQEEEDYHCGDNLFWKFEEGELIIYGEGKMYDFAAGYTPWRKYAGSIRKITVGEGTQTIGANAFDHINRIGSYSTLDRIDLPDSLESIGAYGLSRCKVNGSVHLSSNMKEIKSKAFLSFYPMEIVFEGEKPVLPETCFSKTNSELYIAVPENDPTWAEEREQKPASWLGATVTDWYYAVPDDRCGDTAFVCRTMDNDIVVMGSGEVGNGWLGETEMACDSLIIREGITGLGDFAFAGWSGLKSIDIQSKVFANASSSAFFNCNNVGSVTFNKNSKIKQAQNMLFTVGNKNEEFSISRTYYDCTPFLYLKNEETEYTAFTENPQSTVQYLFPSLDLSLFSGAQNLSSVIVTYQTEIFESSPYAERGDAFPFTVQSFKNSQADGYCQAQNIPYRNYEGWIGGENNHVPREKVQFDTVYALNEKVDWMLSDVASGGKIDRVLQVTVVKGGYSKISVSVNKTREATPWGKYYDSITRLEFCRNEDTRDEPVIVSSQSYSSRFEIGGLFNQMPKLEAVDFSGFHYRDRLDLQLHAFTNNPSLKTIHLPRSLCIVGNYVFAGDSALEYLEFGPHTSIGYHNFDNCTSLKKIRLMSNPGVSNRVFEGLHTTVSLTPYISSFAQQYDEKYDDDITWIIEPSDECGEEAYWKVEDGKLIISGQGEMYDAYTPWSPQLEDINRIIVEEGITHIGTYAFKKKAASYNKDSFDSISLPQSLTSIGAYAFSEVTYSGRLHIPAGVREINRYSFYGHNINGFVFEGPQPTVVTGNTGSSTSSNANLPLGEVSIPDDATWDEVRAAQPATWQGFTVKKWYRTVADDTCGENAYWKRSLDDVIYVYGDGQVRGGWINDYVKECTELVVYARNIGPKAFAGWDTLKKVTLPNDVVCSKDGIFLGCSGVEEVKGNKFNCVMIDNVLVYFEIKNASIAGQWGIPLLYLDHESTSYTAYRRTETDPQTHSYSVTYYSDLDLSLFLHADQLQTVIVPFRTNIYESDPGAFARETNITVQCIQNSQAEKYCQKHSIPYELFDYSLDPYSGLYQQQWAIDLLSFHFPNTLEGFGYDDGYRISLDRYQAAYGDYGSDDLANKLYNRNVKWRGNCFGISAVSLLYANRYYMYSSLNYVSPTDLLRWNDQMDYRTLIELMQVAQYDDRIQDDYCRDYVNRLDCICEEINNLNDESHSNSHQTPMQPAIIALFANNGNRGHILLGYSYMEVDTDDVRLYVYDSNYPGEDRYIQIRKNMEGEYTGWTYAFTDSDQWGSDVPGCWISYVPAAHINELYKAVTGDENTPKLNNVKSMIISKPAHLSFYNSAGELVARLWENTFTSYRDDIYRAGIFGESQMDTDLAYMYFPADECYKVVNHDPGTTVELSMVQTECGIDIKTDAGSFVLGTNDTAQQNFAIVNAAEGDTYEVTVNGEITRGIGKGEAVMVGNNPVETSGSQQTEIQETDSNAGGGAERRDADNNSDGSAERREGTTTVQNPEPAVGEGNEQVPFLQVNAKKVVLKKGQATKGLKVAMAPGDRIASVKSNKTKIVKAAVIDASSGRVKITGKSLGKAFVTITLESGLSERITVTVQKKAVKTRNISLGYVSAAGTKTIRLEKGKRISLQAEVIPFTSLEKLTYQSSDKKVAVVNKKGIVIAKKAGKTRITVKSGAKKKVIQVIVR